MNMHLLLTAANILGHFVGPGARNTLYRDAAHDLESRVNGVLSNFSHCQLDVLYKLFTYYCTSYYGSCLWSLEDSKIEQFYVAWRKSLRKIFKLPSRSHCKLLPIIANCIPIYEQLLCRLYKFAVEARTSNNIINRLLMSVVLNGSKSSVSRSLHVLHLGAYVNETCAYLFNSHNFSSFGKLITEIFFNSMNQEIFVTGHFAREAMYEKEHVSFMTRDELLFMYTMNCDISNGACISFYMLPICMELFIL